MCRLHFCTVPGSGRDEERPYPTSQVWRACLTRPFKGCWSDYGAYGSTQSYLDAAKRCEEQAAAHFVAPTIMQKTQNPVLGICWFPHWHHHHHHLPVHGSAEESGGIRIVSTFFSNIIWALKSKGSKVLSLPHHATSSRWRSSINSSRQV